MIKYRRDEDITFKEYVGFLKRTDLGSQYPEERFKKRISSTLKNRSISISARDENGLLVGICFGLTDFAYFLFITDLGVDRNYERMNIGKQLIKRIQDESGGEDDITVVTVANRKATYFYKKLGYKNDKNALWWKPCKVWTSWTVK